MTTPAEPRLTSKRTAEVGQAGAILDAAETCFARSGYAATSMREIAERARVSKGLLHYHFQTKEQLFVEAQMRAYARLAARIAAVAAPVASSKERGLVALDSIIATLRQTGELRVLAELFAAALSNEHLREHVVRLREFFRALLTKTIGELVGAELGAAGLSIEKAGDLVWALLNGMGFEAAFGSSPERIDGAVAALRHLVAVALGATERTPRPASSLRPSRRK